MLFYLEQQRPLTEAFPGAVCRANCFHTWSNETLDTTLGVDCGYPHFTEVANGAFPSYLATHQCGIFPSGEPVCYFKFKILSYCWVLCCGPSLEGSSDMLRPEPPGAWASIQLSLLPFHLGKSLAAHPYAPGRWSCRLISYCGATTALQVWHPFVP